VLTQLGLLAEMFQGEPPQLRADVFVLGPRYQKRIDDALLEALQREVAPERLAAVSWRAPLHSGASVPSL
jgi:hypothetical protein